jgi:hypothetical protein
LLDRNIQGIPEIGRLHVEGDEAARHSRYVQQVIDDSCDVLDLPLQDGAGLFELRRSHLR